MGGETKTVEQRTLTPEQRAQSQALMEAAGFYWQPSGQIASPSGSNLLDSIRLKGGAQTGGHWTNTGAIGKGWGLTPEEQAAERALLWEQISPQFARERSQLGIDISRRNISGGAGMQLTTRQGAEQSDTWANMQLKQRIQNILRAIQVRQALMQMASGTLSGTGVTTQTTQEGFDPWGSLMDLAEMGIGGASLLGWQPLKKK